MQKFKKIWLFLLMSMIFFWTNLQYAQWWLPVRDHNNNNWSQNEVRISDPTVNEEWISETHSIWSWSWVMSEKSIWILHLPQPEEYETWLWYTLALIQIAINWTLWILSLITLIYIIYNWFLILTSWSDSKNAAKWKKWIGTAAIAIAWIALSWLIISIILRLIRSFA